MQAFEFALKERKLGRYIPSSLRLQIDGQASRLQHDHELGAKLGPTWTSFIWMCVGLLALSAIVGAAIYWIHG